MFEKAASLSCAFLAVLVSWIFSSRAAAADAQGAPRAIVIWTEGPDKDLADAKATSVVAAASGEYTLIDQGELEKALAKEGHRGALAPALKDARRRARVLEKLRRAARKTQVNEVVVVVTRGVGGRATADLLVLDPSTDEPPEEAHLPLSRGSDGLSQAVQQLLPHRQSGAGDSPTPEATPAARRSQSALDVVSPPGQEPSRDSAEASRSPRPRNRIGEEGLDLSAGIEVGMRHFAYRDGLTPNLRPYDLTAAPLVAADGTVYPFSLAGGSPKLLTDVGAVFGYARAFGLQSQSVETAAKLNTQWSRYYLGGRARLRTGPEGSPVVGVVGAYGEEGFAFDAPPNAPPLPSVDYKFVRASGDVRIPFGRVAVLASAGYLVVLSLGDLATRFPRAWAGGVEAELGGALTVATGWEARLTASYRRFFYALHPTPGDTYVAGGALDELGSAQAGVAYVY